MSKCYPDRNSMYARHGFGSTFPLSLFYLPPVFSSIFCGKSAKSCTLAGIKMAGGYQTGTSGPSIRERWPFPRCLFWEGTRKNAGAAVLSLLADPTLWIPVCHCSSSPFAQTRVWLYPSAVMCRWLLIRIIEILGTRSKIGLGYSFFFLISLNLTDLVLMWRIKQLQSARTCKLIAVDPSGRINSIYGYVLSQDLASHAH